MESGTAWSGDGNEQALMGIAIGDYLHNGRPSLYVTHFADDYDTLYRNDGWLDLVAVRGHGYPQVDTLSSGDRYKEPKLLDMNERNGKFCDASEQAGAAIQEPRAARGLAVGDLFHDGNMDLAIENLDGNPSVLRNPGIPGRHWVSFEFRSADIHSDDNLAVVSGGRHQPLPRRESR